jgi:hypothetical protein
VVVDGRVQATGLKTERIDKLVKEAQHTRRYPPDIRFLRHGRQVDVGSGHPSGGGADVWLIRYDPRAQEVTVKSGDNRGKTLVQKNVVREMKRLGAWRGRPAAYKIPPASEDGLKTVVVVQGAKGGRVIAVAQEES